MDCLLAKCMKTDQITSNNLIDRIERVQELLGWFERYATGQHANPKWLEGHALELAYYLATNNSELKINFEAERHKAFKEGLAVPDGSTLKAFLTK